MSGLVINSILLIRCEKFAAILLALIFLNTPVLAAVDECGDHTHSTETSISKLRSGDSFVECDHCPEMVVIAAGQFDMGDLAGDSLSREQPVHTVTISKSFAAGKFEVTYDEWDACVAAGGCTHYPDDANWGRGRAPVKAVSWHDAQEYVTWLSCRTGALYRLPSESEWEYLSRAGSHSRYPWGDEFLDERALCLYCGSDTFYEDAPVGGFEANTFGLHDTVGSIREWVEDCWNNDYEGAPNDGSAWLEGNCNYRVIRGGGYYDKPKFLTSSYRHFKNPDHRERLFGFRVVRKLE